MKRFLSIVFLTGIALFMLTAVSFAEGYSNPTKCPYSDEGSKDSNDNRPMPLTEKNKGGKKGKNGKGKKGKGGKNGKNGKGKNGKNGGGNINPKTPCSH